LDRVLKTIAILDTEWDGSGPSRRMTELAIVNVAYDADEDAVLGILDEYSMGAGQSLDESKSRSILDKADFIVAPQRLQRRRTASGPVSPPNQEIEMAVLVSRHRLEAATWSPECEA
jgi:hypothetical protein